MTCSSTIPNIASSSAKGVNLHLFQVIYTPTSKHLTLASRQISGNVLYNMSSLFPILRRASLKSYIPTLTMLQSQIFPSASMDYYVLGRIQSVAIYVGQSME